MTTKKKPEGQTIMGRPTKYDPQYCQGLVDHMGSGLSFESYAAVIDVHTDTLYQWCHDHTNFSEAKRVGFSKNRLFYEKVGIGIMAGKVEKASATVWIFNMKNRFPKEWRDNQAVELTGRDGGAIPVEFINLSPEERAKRIKELVAKANAKPK